MCSQASAVDTCPFGAVRRVWTVPAQVTAVTDVWPAKKSTALSPRYAQMRGVYAHVIHRFMHRPARLEAGCNSSSHPATRRVIVEGMAPDGDRELARSPATSEPWLSTPLSRPLQAGSAAPRQSLLTGRWVAPNTRSTPPSTDHSPPRRSAEPWRAPPSASTRHGHPSQVANRPASPAVTQGPRHCSRLSPEHSCTSCDPGVTERYPTIVITDDADGLYTTGNPRPDLLRCQLTRAPASCP